MSRTLDFLLDRHFNVVRGQGRYTACMQKEGREYHRSTPISNTSTLLPLPASIEIFYLQQKHIESEILSKAQLIHDT